MSREPMDQARYVIAVMLAVTLVPAISAWYVIHPFARFWRRLGTVASFSIIYALLLSGCVLLWEFRAALVGSDLGFRPWLIAECFNVTDEADYTVTNFTWGSGQTPNSTFGTESYTGTPRTFQFALRYDF